MPRGSTTTAHDVGARSAQYRFATTDPNVGAQHAVPVPPPPAITSPRTPGFSPATPFSYAITLDVYPPIAGRVYPPKPWRRRADRASSAAGNHALQLAATDLEYEVTRVKSPILGRDLNPMGRGDGTYYCNGGNIMGGSVAMRAAKPVFVGESAWGYGDSVNNQGGIGGGGGDQERIDRYIRANSECGVYVVTCPTYKTECGDPCADIDFSDPSAFCCKCLPRLCGSCAEGGCPPTVGCCINYGAEWHEKCGNPGFEGTPPVTQPPGCCGRGILPLRFPHYSGQEPQERAYWPGQPIPGTLIGFRCAPHEALLFAGNRIVTLENMLDIELALRWSPCCCYPDVLNVPWEFIWEAIKALARNMSRYIRRRKGKRKIRPYYIPDNYVSPWDALPGDHCDEESCYDWCEERYSEYRVQLFCREECDEIYG